MRRLKTKISPCFVHFREAVYWSVPTDGTPSRRRLNYCQSQMLSGGIITTSDARWCAKQNPERWGLTNYSSSTDRGTGGWHRTHNANCRCLTRSTDAPTAARGEDEREGEGEGVCRAPSAMERINPPCGRNEEQPDNCWETSRMHLHAYCIFIFGTILSNVHRALKKCNGINWQTVKRTTKQKILFIILVLILFSTPNIALFQMPNDNIIAVPNIRVWSLLMSVVVDL